MNKAQAPRIDVIIVNYNAGSMLGDCVAALKAQSMGDFSAIIVDNGSTDGSLEALPVLDDRFAVLRLGENKGFARGNNLGAAQGSAPFIATLNPDAYAAPNWLEALLAAVETAPGMSMAGSTQIMARDHDRLDGAGDVYTPYGIAWRGGWNYPVTMTPPTGTVFGPCAAAALYRRDAFEAAGGFDEDFFCYHEDVDLAFRLRLSGGAALQVKAAVVYHEGSAISGQQSPFAVYHGVRNRVWTYFKCMPLVPLIVFLPAFIAVSFLFLLRAVIKKQFVATWRGYGDAIGGLGPVLAKRRVIQRARRVSSWRLLRAMTWSPLALLRRAIDVRS